MEQLIPRPQRSAHVARLAGIGIVLGAGLMASTVTPAAGRSLTNDSNFTVVVEPNPLIETGLNEVHAVVQLVSDPYFAHQVVNIDSTQLEAACDGGVTFESLEGGSVTAPVRGSSISVALDGLGNATVTLNASDCAPGTSVVNATDVTAPGTTAAAVLTVDPPEITGAGMSAFPDQETETGSGTVYADFYVGSDPAFVGSPIDIESAPLGIDCAGGWRVEPGNGGAVVSRPSGAVQAQTTVDASGNAVFALDGTSCSSGTFVVTSSLMVAPYTTYQTTFTVVTPPLSVVTPPLQDATVSTTYQATLNAGGGVPPYRWSIAGGALPTATGRGMPLALKSKTGTISGTPGVAGTYHFLASVTDSSTPPQTAMAPLTITVHPSQPAQVWTIGGNATGMVNPPHVAFVLVGDWWCPLVSTSSACSSPKHYKCPRYSSCVDEANEFVGTMNGLIGQDYGASSPYLQQLQAYYCYPSLDCLGQGVQQRLYNGQSFYGPISQAAAADVSSSLNSVASSFGISSQSDASDTVFVFLYAPNTACSSRATPTLNATVSGGPGTYGFNYAKIQLEDYARNCNGPMNNVRGGDLNLQSVPISPMQWATFAVSHEMDEAITSPGAATGFVVPGGGPNGQTGQIADPCGTRTKDGNQVGSAPTYPYWNFTRDSYGTVVSPFVVFSQSATCYPDPSTAVPPA